MDDIDQSAEKVETQTQEKKATDELSSHEHSGVEELISFGDAADDSAKKVPEVKKEAQATTKKETNGINKAKVSIEEDLAKEVSCTDIKVTSTLALWLKRQNIHDSVLKLLYWKDVKKSGIVFATLLVLLLSMNCCSVITVVSMLGFALLVVAFLYRIGMTIVNAVQKTSAEHPFKAFLEEKIEIPEDKAQEMALKLTQKLNEHVRCLQKLFLIDDVIESIKFGLLLWLVSYVGAWFSVLTLLTIGLVVAFTIPKLYEEKQKEIDELVNTLKKHMCKACSTIEEKMPEKIKQLVFRKNKKE